MTARAALPRDPAGAARALLPIVLVLLAAVVRETRLAVLVALVAGTLVAVHREAPVRWAWAGPVPVALSLCFGLIPPPSAEATGLDCSSIVSPPAVWRLLEALLVLGVVRCSGGQAAGACLQPVPALSVAPGRRDQRGRLRAVRDARDGRRPGLAQPFFGAFGLDLSGPVTLVPALIFALANGIMEEIAYRGALMGWSARVIGLVPARGTPGDRVRAGARRTRRHQRAAAARRSVWRPAGCWPGSSPSEPARCCCRSRSTSRSTCRSTSIWPVGSAESGHRPSTLAGVLSG